MRDLNQNLPNYQHTETVRSKKGDSYFKFLHVQFPMKQQITKHIQSLYYLPTILCHFIFMELLV